MFRIRIISPIPLVGLRIGALDGIASRWQVLKDCTLRLNRQKLNQYNFGRGSLDRSSNYSIVCFSLLACRPEHDALIRACRNGTEVSRTFEESLSPLRFARPKFDLGCARLKLDCGIRWFTLMVIVKAGTFLHAFLYGSCCGCRLKT